MSCQAPLGKWVRDRQRERERERGCFRDRTKKEWLCAEKKRKCNSKLYTDGKDETILYLLVVFVKVREIECILGMCVSAYACELKRDLTRSIKCLSVETGCTSACFLVSYKALSTCRNFCIIRYYNLEIFLGKGTTF